MAGRGNTWRFLPPKKRKKETTCLINSKLTLVQRRTPLPSATPAGRHPPTCITLSQCFRFGPSSHPHPRGDNAQKRIGASNHSRSCGPLPSYLSLRPFGVVVVVLVVNLENGEGGPHEQQGVTQWCILRSRASIACMQEGIRKPMRISGGPFPIPPRGRRSRKVGEWVRAGTGPGSGPDTEYGDLLLALVSRLATRREPSVRQGTKTARTCPELCPAFSGVTCHDYRLTHNDCR